jgi:hypothetical protein
MKYLVFSVSMALGLLLYSTNSPASECRQTSIELTYSYLAVVINDVPMISRSELQSSLRVGVQQETSTRSVRLNLDFMFCSDVDRIFLTTSDGQAKALIFEGQLETMYVARRWANSLAAAAFPRTQIIGDRDQNSADQTLRFYAQEQVHWLAMPQAPLAPVLYSLPLTVDQIGEQLTIQWHGNATTKRAELAKWSIHTGVGFEGYYLIDTVTGQRTQIDNLSQDASCAAALEIAHPNLTLISAQTRVGEKPNRKRWKKVAPWEGFHVISTGN